MRKKDKIELGITVVLGVVLLVASLLLFQKMKTRQGPRPAVSSPTAKTVSRAKGPSHGKILHRKKVDGEKFINRFNLVTAALPLERDPFTAGQAKARDAKAVLPLNGILWDPTNPVAVVGTDFLKEGDSVDRFKIVKIHPTKVVFQDGGTQFEVSLNQDT